MSTAIQEPLSLTSEVEHAEHRDEPNGATKSNGDAKISTTSLSRFDPHFTDNVINATGPKANPRLRKVMGSLTRHLHDFCRENEITIDEYMAAIEMVSESPWV